MKKIIASLVLMAIASTFLSFAFTGDFNAWMDIAAALFVLGVAKSILKIDGNTNGLTLDGFVISDTTYAGEAAANFIVKAITGNDTIQGGHVYVKDGIKKQFTIPRFDANYTDFIQDRAATPVSKGTMTVDGKALVPQDYMIYTEVNPRDYEAHWYSLQMNPTLIDRTLPQSVESVVVQEVLKRHNRYLNQALWTSDTSLVAPSVFKYFDGFIKKAKAAADTNIVASPVALTSANIQGEMLRAYQLIPAALRYNVDMKIFCSYATFDLYAQSQINQTYKGVDITLSGIPKFKGLDIVKIADIPDNMFFIAKGKSSPEGNLWVGMNSQDDARLEFRPLQANSEMWFIKMLMKLDVQIGWNNETVYYGS